MFFATLQFNHIYCVWGKSKVYFSVLQSFELAMQDSDPGLSSTKTLYHLYISDLFHVQKMLTALFKLVWNTQKSTWINFFAYQGKMFLNIEKVLLKIREEQP